MLLDGRALHWMVLDIIQLCLIVLHDTVWYCMLFRDQRVPDTRNIFNTRLIVKIIGYFGYRVLEKTRFLT